MSSVITVALITPKRVGITYDNDKRQLESYFAELFHERSDKSGKRVSILVDSDAVNEYPLYRIIELSNQVQHLDKKLNKSCVET